MTLWIDKRHGSGEFEPLLRDQFHLPVASAQFAAGDFYLLGRGEHDTPIPVGVERKALGDLLTCLQDGRLVGDQLPKLLQSYLQVWIVIEGLWRPDYKTGQLLVPKGKKWLPTTPPIMYRDLELQLITLEMRGGVLLRRTGSKLETARFLAALYHWWTDKAWDEHKSHLRLHTPHADQALLIPPKPVRIVAAQLPGIGWSGKSKAVAGHFKSVRAMVAASEQDWTPIPGIGKGIAKKVQAWLDEE